MKNSLALFVIVIGAQVAAFAAKDLTVLEQARSLYNKGQFQKAVDAYSKIEKSSDYYVDALEEKAQALGQQGKYAEALSQIKSALAPQFEGLVGAEAYLTAAITELKTCDYTAVLETSGKFKKSFAQRLKNLEALASPSPSKVRDQAYQKAKAAGQVSILSLGSLVRELPRNSIKDKSLLKLIKNSAGFDLRLRTLAREEIKNIDRVISLLQLAEVEVEHRLNVMQASGKRHKQGGYQKSNDVLVFPDDEEVWFDEIGNYQAQVETCPDLSRRAGL